MLEGYLMVFDAIGQDEVAPSLKRSIVFHIRISITEDFDCSISLIRCLGSGA